MAKTNKLDFNSSGSLKIGAKPGDDRVREVKTPINRGEAAPKGGAKKGMMSAGKKK